MNKPRKLMPCAPGIQIGFSMARHPSIAPIGLTGEIEASIQKGGYIQVQPAASTAPCVRRKRGTKALKTTLQRGFSDENCIYIQISKCKLMNKKLPPL
jgi:hypothetical protein